MPIRLKQKFEGCLLGLAIGDALGYAVEFSSMDEIRRRYGPKGIQELDLRGSTALFSDDTQMTIAVANGLIADGKDVTVESSAPLVAAEFVSWSRNPPGGHRAPGGACMAGCRALSLGAEWEEAGGGIQGNRGGCGSVMRSAPYGLYFWNSEDDAIEIAARHSRMTHGAPLALAASAALASGIYWALRDAHPMTIAFRMVDAAARYDVTTARMLVDVQNLAKSVMCEEITPAAATERVLDRYRGWAGHEAIASALFCFLMATLDSEAGAVDGVFAETIRLGANSPGDSDSIACIAGALAGAWVGIGGIPERFVKVIERRDELFQVATKLHYYSGAATVLFQLTPKTEETLPETTVIGAGDYLNGDEREFFRLQDEVGFLNAALEEERQVIADLKTALAAAVDEADSLREKNALLEQELFNFRGM